MDSVKLWTPQGSTYVGGNTAGYNRETGVSIVVHTFQFNDPETGRGQIVKIPANQRKQIGKQIKEFKEYAEKRRESTNNRIYYKGISDK